MKAPPAGRLLLTAGLVGGRSRLLALECEPPLQAMRALHLDPLLPDMAFVTVMSPSGGVLQGDRLTLEVSALAGARLHLDTASATRVYRMPRAEARQEVRVSVGAGALVELMPEPFLPYAGSRFVQSGRHVVDETGTLILAEVVAPGRQARGESLAYSLFESLVEVSRPDGSVLFRDWARLEPAHDLGRRGMLGGHVAVGSLLVVSRGLESSVLATGIESVMAGQADVEAGCSELPNEAGAWLRVLAADSTSAMAVVRAAWTAARVALTSAPPPPARRH